MRVASAGEEALGHVDQRSAHSSVGATGEGAILTSHRMNQDRETDQSTSSQCFGRVPADRRTPARGRRTLREVIESALQVNVLELALECGGPRGHAGQMVVQQLPGMTTRAATLQREFE